MLGYTKALEATGKYLLMIWPEHCLIGSAGHAVHPDLFSALVAWEKKRFANIDFVTKGVNPFTEHFGGLMAEVPLASDPSTGLNTKLLEVLQSADIVAVAGEALSHCVLTTVTQIADNIGEDHVKKFHILTDCTSPVPAVPNGPDFPAIGKQWLKDMEKRGMTLTTSEEFLS
jgi:nicotinamidase/pyrazinamidase